MRREGEAAAWCQIAAEQRARQEASTEEDDDTTMVAQQAAGRAKGNHSSGVYLELQGSKGGSGKLRDSRQGESGSYVTGLSPGGASREL